MAFSSNGFDPQLLIQKVIDLSYDFTDRQQRWNSAFEEATYIQKHTEEALSQISVWVSSIFALVHEDGIKMDRITGDADRCREQIIEWSSQVEAVENASSAAHVQAEEKQAHWQSRLEEAKEWVERAEERCERTQNEYDEGEHELNSAQSALSDAQLELDDARERTEPAGRDKDGETIYKPIDTTPYEDAVTEAEERVERCERALDQAREELESAERELSAAKDRETACVHAVTIAEAACEEASKAVFGAEKARCFFERVEDEQLRLQNILNQMELSRMRSDELVTDTSRFLHESQESQSRSRENYEAAATLHEEAKQLTLGGVMEIRYRLERLLLFDNPLK